MKFKSLLVLLAGTSIASSTFGAIVSAPWSGPGEQNLYSILGFADNNALNNSILNQAGGPGNGGVTATDWNVATSDAAHYSSLLIEMAGNANNNEFGIYRLGAGNEATRLSIFNGPAGPDLTSAGAQQLIVQTVLGDTKIYLNSVSGPSIDIHGDANFGFYLDTGHGTFYSTISQNSDGIQHVVAFNVMNTLFGQSPYPTAGQSGYIMGWEDLPAGSSDLDYQDMVVSLTALPIPEPTTVIAGALLLVPFGASTIRTLRRKSAAG